MHHKKEREPISQSFVMGVIALVFLIIGYQTALFIHHSAITRIAPNRDEPDTVYVYRSHPSAGYAEQGNDNARHRPNTDTPVPMRNADSVVRRNAEHSPIAQAVRSNIPPKKVESFPFNPNTVSVDDLCRLGFSAKQARSIDNYRKKGGRFNRKSDFAKSFVVSDSIYARLESFIDIPLLDLNQADSAAFDNLPGIGGWFARKMVEHRAALGGYSYKEQLMDIWKFDREKYEALSDLVTVEPQFILPYPIWSLPADSLSKHPYIGEYSAKGIVLFRENNPESKWTVEELIRAGIIHPDNAGKLSRIVIAGK